MRSYARWRDRTVVVNLADAAPVRGVLWAERRDLLVLKNARVLAGGEMAPVDGDVVVERARIAFVQVLP